MITGNRARGVFVLRLPVDGNQSTLHGRRLDKKKELIETGDTSIRVTRSGAANAFNSAGPGLLRVVFPGGMRSWEGSCYLPPPPTSVAFWV